MNYDAAGVLLFSGISSTSSSAFYYAPSGRLTITGVVNTGIAFRYDAALGRLFRILGVGPLVSTVVVNVSPPENLFLLQGPIFRELPPKTRPKTFAYDHQAVAKGIFSPRHGAYLPEITARGLQKIKRSDIKPGMDLTGKIVVD